MPITLNDLIDLQDGVDSSAEGNIIANAIVTRSPLSSDDVNALMVGVAGSAEAQEIAAALVSGAPLSVEAKRRICLLLADENAGNDLINMIQLVPTPPFRL